MPDRAGPTVAPRRQPREELSSMSLLGMGSASATWSTPADAERTLAILKQHGRVAQRIGTAVSDPQKIVRITARGLAGQHKRFWRDDRAARVMASSVRARGSA